MDETNVDGQISNFFPKRKTDADCISNLDSLESAFEGSFDVASISDNQPKAFADTRKRKNDSGDLNASISKRANATFSTPKNRFEESIRFLTGNVEKVLKWNQILRSYCLYEVIAPVISMRPGELRYQKIIFLRDRKGPVMKVVHYDIDNMQFPEIRVGQIVRCAGKMIGKNSLHAFHVREATEEEILSVPRMSNICDLEITRKLN
ncbi:PREDICTED: uncharacterized protein LOC108562741 [Nicrophorus vespilloides]|uniref:Uncharacterized protein LOC108562741 n=1 Tax=Nicrophorus vespilloides TaxID=110193 RepID=A0ABM1MPZ9_NICVS|nr:PREDICTED: uncharacterized protein LOC108562741 [Nicrophorus vespilloides]XP_017776650.1 PREDICTED: uncharacterized protein LOC108562741 [Nicrophorus vespilloides]